MVRRDDSEIVREGGFTGEEVQHLIKVRQYYDAHEGRQVAAEYRRLEFIRWLVMTGKLSEQITSAYPSTVELTNVA